MARHIGIIGATPEGTALCYREIFRHARRLMGDAPRPPPPITLHNEPVERYMNAVRSEDWHTISRLLMRSAEIVAQAGAEFCVMPDNVMQYGVHLCELGSPIPWLKMADLVADAIEKDGRKRVGVIGTRMVTSGTMYQVPLGLRGIEVLRPHELASEKIDSIIYSELVYGVVKRESQRTVLDVIEDFAARGCEGVILGCSEAPLVVTHANSPIPSYDATSVLAEGAVRACMGELAVERGTE